MATYFIEKTIGSKVESAGKAIGITEDADADKEEREKKKKESKEKREMEEKKRKYLEERRVKRHEENKARNDGIRNKYDFFVFCFILFSLLFFSFLFFSFLFFSFLFFSFLFFSFLFFSFLFFSFLSFFLLFSALFVFLRFCRYTFAEKEEKKSSGISLFKKEEPKNAPLQSKKNAPVCIVEGCGRTASVVQPVCPHCEQPVCYNHRLQTDHPCSTVAAVKGAAGSVFDSMVGYVESAKSEFDGPGNERGRSNEEEEAVVKRGLETSPPGGKGEKEEEEEFSWDYISKRLEETKESLTDSVQSSLREFNLAGEHELTEEEKRYWGGIEEEKQTPPHHPSKEEEEEKTVGEVVDEVASSISSWFNGEGESSAGQTSQPKESEGSSFFSSWF